jgi:ribosomal protein S27E
MRWILKKEEKNIFGLTIKTVKCSNCGNEETVHPGCTLSNRCYVCEQEEENE